MNNKFINYILAVVGLLISLASIFVPVAMWAVVREEPLSLVIRKFTVTFWNTIIFSSFPFIFGIVLILREIVFGKTISLMKHIFIYCYILSFMVASIWLNYSARKYPDPFWGLIYFAYAFVAVVIFVSLLEYFKKASMEKKADK